MTKKYKTIGDKIKALARREKKVMVRFVNSDKAVKGVAFMTHCGPKLWISSANLTSLDSKIVADIRVMKEEDA